MNFTLADFDFALPPELIAQHPAERAQRLAPARRARQLRRPIACASANLPYAARAGRPAGVQRHARDQGAPVRPRSPPAARSRLLVERVLAAASKCWPTCAPASHRGPAATMLRLAGAFDAEVLGRAGARRRAVPPALSRPTRWCCWKRMAMCRCRPTSRTPTRIVTQATMRSATRPSSPPSPARWRRPRRRCTSTQALLAAH